MPRRASLGLLLVLFLACCAPALAQEKSDLEIVIMSRGGVDQVAVAYEKEVDAATARNDMVKLAHALNQPTPSPIEVGKADPKDPRGKMSVSANLTGLSNAATGQVNLDPILRTFADYRHFQIVCMFDRPVPAGNEVTRSVPPWKYTFRPGGSSVSYEVWIEHKNAIRGALPGVYQQRRNYVLPLVLGILAFLLVVIGAIWFIVRILRSPAGEQPAEEALEGES